MRAEVLLDEDHPGSARLRRQPGAHRRGGRRPRARDAGQGRGVQGPGLAAVPQGVMRRR
ncbi:hypothetical protein OF001_U10148 [Pseudomonas sp. OF001]|nr:hypothetical protein OF001_U10148 [Pseudomonas sp. OF001]